MDILFVDLVKNYWYIIIVFVFSVLALYNCKKKNRIDNNLITLSRITLVVASILFLFSIFIFVFVVLSTIGAEILFYAIIIIYSLCVFFSFISSLYRNTVLNIQYQHIRNIIIWLINIIFLLIFSLTFVLSLIINIANGMILPISDTKALNVAKSQFDTGVKYGGCYTISKERWSYGSFSAYIPVECAVYLGNTDEILMNKRININARTGKVVYLDNEYKAKIIITKDGKPLANTHFFSGNIEKLNGIYGHPIDYSITNSEGELTMLLMPGYTNRIFSLDYKYLDIDAKKDANVVLNWNDAKQLPKNGVLFLLDPNSSPISSPYENSTNNIESLPISSSSADWKIYRNNRTDYQIEYPANGLVLDLDETIKLNGTDPNDSATTDMVQFATKDASYSIKTIFGAIENDIENWIINPNNYLSLGSDISLYQKTTLGNQTAYQLKTSPTVTFAMKDNNVYIIQGNSGNGPLKDPNDSIYKHILSSFIFTTK